MTNFFEHSLIINKKQTLIDITSYINDDISLSKIQDGIVIVYCPHTTAGITINENADPDVVDDLIYGYEKAYPSIDSNYKHFEGNSHAHLKSSCIGHLRHLFLIKVSLF